jgi:two-component system response regulator RegA
MRDRNSQRPDLLIVDDDETFSCTLARAFARRGYRTAVTNTVADAAQAIDAEPPSYAIIDLCIGADSGLPLVDRCKRRDPEMRIVVLTGYASITTAVEAIKLGATQYLTKPASTDEILDALHRDKGNPEIRPRPLPMSVGEVEWEHLQKVLREHEGNISAAARALGMHRRTLQRKLQKRPADR